MEDAIAERTAAFSKMMLGFSRKTSDGDPSAFSNPEGKAAIFAVWVLSALPILWLAFEAFVHNQLDNRPNRPEKNPVFVRLKRPLRFVLASLDCLAVFIVVFIAVYGGGGMDARPVERPIVSHDPLGEFSDPILATELFDNCCFSASSKLDDFRSSESFRKLWFFPMFCKWFAQASREFGRSLPQNVIVKAGLLGLDLSPTSPPKTPFLPSFPVNASFAETLASLRLAKLLAQIDPVEGLRFSIGSATLDENWTCTSSDPAGLSYSKLVDDWFKEAESASLGRKFPSSLSCWNVDGANGTRRFLEFPEEPSFSAGEKSGLRKACCVCRSSFGDPAGTSLVGAVALVAVHLAVASFAAVGLKTGIDNDRSLYGKLVLLSGVSLVAFVYSSLVGKLDAYGLRSSKSPEVASILEPCAALYFEEDSSGLKWLTLYIAVSAVIKTAMFRIFALRPKTS